MALDSGKTALSATVGIDSDFPYVKIVSSFQFPSFLGFFFFLLSF